MEYQVFGLVLMVWVRVIIGLPTDGFIMPNGRIFLELAGLPSWNVSGTFVGRVGVSHSAWRGVYAPPSAL